MRRYGEICLNQQYYGVHENNLTIEQMQKLGAIWFDHMALCKISNQCA